MSTPYWVVRVQRAGKSTGSLDSGKIQDEELARKLYSMLKANFSREDRRITVWRHSGAIITQEKWEDDS